MAWKILVTAPYLQPAIDRFRQIFDENGIKLVLPKVDERLEEDELLGLVGDIHGVICGDDRFTKKVLESAPQLKVISKWGTGIDSIDQTVCRQLGVTICNTPNAFSEPVADSILGYIICFARKLPWMDYNIKQGVWDKIPGKALRECTLGVIGVGNVGKAVVRRATAFGMKIIGNDIESMPAAFLEKTGIEMISKDELLEQADFVSLNCDLNPTSYHLMSQEEFARMKNSSVVINTARGPIIDESALTEALQKQHIAGAALDVFETEPLPADSPLRNMDNVLMAPHNANSSPEAWENVHSNTINNLIHHLSKGQT
ncbi:phosphoglycerate dehydrogenase [uncultured Desulfosarcina sp.]|uniref:phosphoglycerate dehydrogenase n=1 Tax=uncultured Desulfosarcina sp. TaxID=218289 RepID=UPI0029C82AA4|nr:phosphoglycerate dehydrogenase [uncultured Desulfosarcina sp.]